MNKLNEKEMARKPTLSKSNYFVFSLTQIMECSMETFTEQVLRVLHPLLSQADDKVSYI
jgi:hypothetical protein